MGTCIRHKDLLETQIAICHRMSLPCSDRNDTPYGYQGMHWSSIGAWLFWYCNDSSAIVDCNLGATLRSFDGVRCTILDVLRTAPPGAIWVVLI